ncbi:MAG: hypothetical protein EA398_17515 [Deltaproteobacteria bacterium]|nr:MAG: hypothetical protein EA398_17515 [Deltaproteobacteria bacterium]
MEFQVKDTIPHPRETVWTTHRDHLVELAEYLPNIETIEVESRTDEGDITRLVNLWKAAPTEVPAPARPFIKPEMLRWIDRATWNRGEWRCQWDIELGFLPEAVSARGFNRFLEEDGHCTIEINGEIEVRADRIPGVPRLVAGRLSGAIEKFVVNLIRPNLLKTNEAARRFIESHG